MMAASNAPGVPGAYLIWGLFPLRSRPGPRRPGPFCVCRRAALQRDLRLRTGSVTCCSGRGRRGVPVVASVAVVLSGAALASAATGQPSRAGDGPSRGIRHALLISVDGLHQQDLAWYVKAYPDSVLAALDHRGLEYSNADTPFPSDSFPGMVGQVTGGDPRVGVPAIFGMNFQTVSTDHKLPAADGLRGGSRPGGSVPCPLLVRALNSINTEVDAMVARLRT